MTRSIVEWAKPLRIAVHDCIIIGEEGDASGPILTFASRFGSFSCEC